jgi:hypothetical protein
MTDDEAATLRTEHANLQRQLVEMRLRHDQLADSLSALVAHLVRKEVEALVGARLPTELERQHLSALFKAATDRARMRADVFLHLAKWGIGGGVGFFLYAAWEAVKAKLRIQE